MATPAAAPADVRERRHAGAHRRRGTCRSSASCTSPRVGGDALPGALASRRRPTASSSASAAAFRRSRRTPLPAPLRAAREATGAHRGPRRAEAVSRRRTRTTMRRGSAIGWPSSCRCRCPSSRACSRSTTARCAFRCCRSSCSNRGSLLEAAGIICAHLHATRERRRPWPATANGRTSSTRRPRPTRSAARSSRASSRKSRSRRDWAALIRR